MEATHTTEVDSEDLLFSLLNVSVLECDESDIHEAEFLPIIFRMYEDKRKEPNTSSSENQVKTDEGNKTLSVTKPIQSIQAKIEGTDNAEITEEYPKRIRRSKYDYISGDLSHIRRDPKCIMKRKGAVTETPGSSKKICFIPEYSPKMESSQIKDEKLQVNNDVSHRDEILPVMIENTLQIIEDKADHTDEKEDDILVVRELMKYLYSPKTKEHQNVALALLSADPNLMRIFIKETKNTMRHIVSASGNCDL